MQKITKFRVLFNLGGIFLILLIFGNLIKKDFILSGDLSLESNLEEKTPMLSIIYPEHRAINQGDHYQIISEPVYFTVRSPINFEKAEVEIEFDPENQDIIYLGYAEDEEQDAWSYKTHTLYNKSLDNIDWQQKTDGINTLWQKEAKFDSVDDFIKVGNSLDSVGAYDFELKENFILNDYTAQNEYNVIENCLRGEHQFYTYIKDEALDFKFKIQDINRTEGEDYLIIKIYNPQGKKIYSRLVSDDGYSSNLDPASDPRYISIYLDNLDEGVYKIELSANDDIFIREIKTKQQKISFINRLYLCDNPEYLDGFVDLKYKPTSIITSARLLSFYTAHQKGLQNVTVDQKIVNINKQHQWFNIESTPQISEIYVPKNDLKISGQGLFALQKSYYFNPEIISLKNYSASEDLKYVIARYQVPKKLDNNYLKNTVYFNLNNAKVEDGSLKFIISAPELKTQKNEIKIKNIKVKLSTYQKKTSSEAWHDLIIQIKNKFQYYLKKFKK